MIYALSLLLGICIGLVVLVRELDKRIQKLEREYSFSLNSPWYSCGGKKHYYTENRSLKQAVRLLYDYFQFDLTIIEKEKLIKRKKGEI